MIFELTFEPVFSPGMFANLHKSLNNFDQDTLEMCAREAEFKSILFSLCYFHAVVAERRKFGPQGWNRVYPFNTGDLTISCNVLYNYLEANSKVPWEDLRYLFGEIMYGGHITDDWDRRLCRTYLEEYMQPDMVSILHLILSLTKCHYVCCILGDILTLLVTSVHTFSGMRIGSMHFKATQPYNIITSFSIQKMTKYILAFPVTTVPSIVAKQQCFISSEKALYKDVDEI